MSYNVSFNRSALAKAKGWRVIGSLCFLLALTCLAATGRSYHVFRSALLILGMSTSAGLVGYAHRIVVELKRRRSE